MKKGLLVLATLLLISCVNLNEHKGERVIVNTKSSGTKSNVANAQKNNKKKNTSANNTKVIKTRNLLKEAEAISEDTYVNKVKK